MKLIPFHLAIPVHDIELCRKFYKDILGCIEGRSDKDWVDFNFFGHQLVIHYQEKSGNLENVNQVDGKSVPIPHFGLVLEWDTFTNFAKNLKVKGIKFIIEPSKSLERLKRILK